VRALPDLSGTVIALPFLLARKQPG
jgi:hypothetical protein